MKDTLHHAIGMEFFLSKKTVIKGASQVHITVTAQRTQEQIYLVQKRERAWIMIIRYPDTKNI
jgi:hypothetical protein